MLRTSALLISVLTAGAAQLPAQTPDTLRDTTARRLAQLERELEILRLELRRQAELLARHDSVAMVAEAAGLRAAAQAPDPRVRQVSGIASRPFLYRGVGAAVGGYVDLEFTHEFDADATHFTQHRFIPFVFAEISDRLHFGTEIEFEYGGPDFGSTKDGEVKVEFAAIDLGLTSWLHFRAGALLSPLGKFNLIHDSPVNDLTDRPLVANRIVPTTLTEAGAGFFGRWYPGDAAVVTYEAYLVNGFNHGVVGYAIGADSTIRGTMNVRNARNSMRRDNNPAKSLVGRLAVSPILGVELGVSGHTGRYGDGGTGRLTVAALDAIVARGAWEVLGEYAVADLTVDRAAETGRARAAYQAAVGDTTGFGAAFPGATFVTAQRGGYLQLNYHFLQGVVPGFALSTFTAVARFDHLDLNADVDGDLQQRLSLGANWRPIEQAAIKLDYQWNWATPAGATGRLAATTRLVASVATYF